MTLALPFAIFLGLLLAAGGGSQPQPDPGPDLDPDEPGPDPDPGSPPITPIPIDPDKWDGLIPPPEDEDLLDALSEDDILTAACSIWGARSPGESDSSLALRTLRGLFPGMTWPGTPGGRRSEAQQRFQAVFSDIRSGLITCDTPINPETVPRAGSMYQIKKNDNLFGIVQTAYPGLNAQQRVQAAKMVINHPRNGAGKIGSGIIVATTMEGNKNLLGDAIVSFNPRWNCLANTEHSRYLAGSCYAIVYLPEI